MILELTTDANLVTRIMTDDDIWQKIKTDSITKDQLKSTAPLNPDSLFNNVLALSAKVEEIIGIHIFKEINDRVIYHPMLLKRFRKQFGREFFDKGINWLFENTIYKIIDVEIPVTHRSTINLAKNLDFKESGIKKDGVNHDGKTLDLQLLRLKR